MRDLRPGPEVQDYPTEDTMPFDDTSKRADNPTVAKLRELREAILTPGAWCQETQFQVRAGQEQRCLYGWMLALRATDLIYQIEPLVRRHGVMRVTGQAAIARIERFNDRKTTTPAGIAKIIDKAIEASDH